MSSQPFTFSFSTPDIDVSIDTDVPPNPPPQSPQPAPTTPASSVPATAFPLPSRPLLPPTCHPLTSLLSTLPSTLAYSTLTLPLDSGTLISLPRRELWDVRVQLMAEAGSGDDGDDGAGLGREDVKTGIYEGGFKSWESSGDLVRVLEGRLEGVGRVVELGCGTALPSLALLQTHLATTTAPHSPLAFALADYNPSVLSLVTLPNLLLTWAQYQAQTSSPPTSWPADGELDVTPAVTSSFLASLATQNISLSFFSGTWSPEFVDLVCARASMTRKASLLVLAAETIYSPFALRLCVETVVGILSREGAEEAEGVEGEGSCALVAAKKVYFGVGGSMEEFCERAVRAGCRVRSLREETVGVRREVVKVWFGGGAGGMEL